MFQYTKEIILSGVADRVTTSSATNPYSGVEATKLLIKRCGEYFSDYIQNEKVYVTEGKKGHPGELVIDFADVDLAPGLYQLQFRVKTSLDLAEYANPNWQEFGKPMLIGFDVTEEMKDDVTLLAKKLVELINLAVPENNRFINVEADGTKVVIKGTDNHMSFDKYMIEKYDPTVCDSCLGEYSPVSVSIESKDNVEDFATGE